MEPIIVWYLRMSVFYFVAGALIGVAMLIWPEEAGYYITVHAHLNLLGFMSMMIYGVGYHILPKFSGRNIYSPLIVNLQFWFANAGLIGIAVSWPYVIRGLDTSLPKNILIVSAFLSLASVILFAFNMLKTIKAVKM
jgi:cbb3-type cytochrome oxidase subunit 1